MADLPHVPRSGDTVILTDGSPATVAWCSGWTWPLGYPGPTHLYVQVEQGRRVSPELRVIAARDNAGRRFWLAERRSV